MLKRNITESYSCNYPRNIAMHMATDKLTIRPHRTVNVFEMDAAPPGHSESLPDSAKYSVAWELGNAPCKQIRRI
jgi:hypothetical protein